MRLCFFSDIHGNGFAYDAFLNDSSCRNIDRYIFGGDFFGYYYDTNRILTDIRNRGFTCILGNHDEMFLQLVRGNRKEQELITRYGNSYQRIVSRISVENLNYLKQLPFCYNFKEDGLRLGFFHGSPENPINGRIYPDTEIIDDSAFKPYDYVFLGHTHHKMLRRIGNCILINPGSAGQQRDGRGTSYVVFDTETKKLDWFCFDYPIEQLVRQIDENESVEQQKESLKKVLFRTGKIYTRLNERKFDRNRKKRN